ncbi:MAG: acyl-CoA dehydrogenase family protein [Acidimicrobiales bacterium]|nr:acyl-CoA dehydrogenase family protein [Acidimicrobiales bacterium]
MPPTHEVVNQPPPLAGFDRYGADSVLVEAVERNGAGWAGAELHELGRLAGSSEWIERGRLANEYPPVLRTHDRYGHRVDLVEHHPAYHELMGVAVGAGLHAHPWSDDRPGAHVARAAKIMLWYQVEPGHICPISMTYSVVPALRAEPAEARRWEPLLASAVYDPAQVPAADKAGITCGMAMTEKQGGSDVRANSTRAEADADGHRLTGHKWFCSAPMSDLFLTLAQASEGLTCFLVPRRLPDGEVNGIRIQRLKDKLGDRANASSEIEFDSAFAVRIGEPGRGVATIIEMVNHTRLDCLLGSAALCRQGTAEALHHAAHRNTFGRRLVEHPLMANVLADLAVESEAATALALRVARSHDPAQVDEHELALRRVLTPVAKYWTCKRAPAHAAEALECLGGNGYAEESHLPRLFRQSPLNGIWEGSGNVICLDVLRAVARSPESVDAVMVELDAAAGADVRLDAAVNRLRLELGSDPAELETQARRFVEQLAVCFQASLLVRFAPSAVADAYCASRLDGAGVFGTLPRGVDTAPIIERHMPA